MEPRSGRKTDVGLHHVKAARNCRFAFGYQAGLSSLFQIAFFQSVGLHLENCCLGYWLSAAFPGRVSANVPGC
jgi:hypothetical protein